MCVCACVCISYYTYIYVQVLRLLCLARIKKKSSKRRSLQNVLLSREQTQNKKRKNKIIKEKNRIALKVSLYCEQHTITRIKRQFIEPDGLKILIHISSIHLFILNFISFGYTRNIKYVHENMLECYPFNIIIIYTIVIITIIIISAYYLLITICINKTKSNKKKYLIMNKYFTHFAVGI